MNVLTITQSDIFNAIELADLADSTRYQYRKAIRNAVEAGVNLADADQLAAYAQGLKKSSRAFLKSALRLWSNGIVSKAKAGATPDNVNAVQATVYRVEALQEAITVKDDQGQKAHIWLSQAEVKTLLGTCNAKTIQGRRDRVVLALLVGAGLRREELANLTFDDIKQQPVKGKVRTVLDVTGKGAKDRTIPVSDALAALLDEWAGAVGSRGYVARSVSKGGAVGDSISAVGIFHIVNSAGQEIGQPELAPHDLRRTYAQIGYEAGVPITQISKLLGHANIATTQRYLNLDLDLDTTISDFVPIV